MPASPPYPPEVAAGQNRRIPGTRRVNVEVFGAVREKFFERRVSQHRDASPLSPASGRRVIGESRSLLLARFVGMLPGFVLFSLGTGSLVYVGQIQSGLSPP